MVADGCMIPPCPDPPSSGSRVLPRDILELKALAERQPELAPAATLQVDLIEAVRRVQGRITTPWIETSAETLNARLASGQPLLEFAQIAFDWNDVRLLIRQVTDVLRRHEVIDAADRGGAARGWPQPDAARRDARLVRAAAGARHRDAGRSARLGGAPVSAAHRRSAAAARQPRSAGGAASARCARPSRNSR